MTPTTSTLRSDFRQGAQDIFPILLGIIPFGLVAGAVAIDTGLTIGDAMALSLFVFAGASQLAAIELLGNQAPIAVAVFTIAVINLRHLMYSASLAPHFAGLPLRHRVPATFIMTDQSYAVTIARAEEIDDPRRNLAYFLGAAIPLYVTWQLFTLIGTLVGAAIPDAIPLTFAIPMVFLVLLVPALKDRPAIAAAVTAGVGATVLGFLPANLGLFVSALGGVAVGTLLTVRGER
ncbi:MAG: 4-azaleucine resistance transporter AzlC [Glaciecola sp.]